MKARTCLSTDVVESDEFLSLSQEAQLCYVHLCSASKPSGRLTGTLRILRGYGYGETELQELVSAGYVLPVGGVYFIRDCWVNNKYDARLFKIAMDGCQEYQSGLIRFVGEDGKSAYTTNVSRLLDYEVNRSEGDVTCCDDEMTCSEDDSESDFEMTRREGIPKGGEDSNQSQHTKVMTPTEQKCLENYLYTLEEKGFDVESTEGCLLNAFRAGGSEKMFQEYLRLCGM